MTVKDVVVDRIRDEMVDYLKSQDAFWNWEGHKHVAELASGKLSDFFANLSPIHTNIFLQEKIGWALVHKAFHGELSELQHANLWVIGSAMGAIGLAQAVARAVHAYNSEVRCGFTEPVYSYGVKTKRMELKRFSLGENPRVILVEDVMTTGGTTDNTIRAVTKAGKGYTVTFCGKVLVVIDRRMDDNLEGMGETGMHDIVSLLRTRPRVWDTEAELPDKIKGCVPIRPKESWHELVTEML